MVFAEYLIKKFQNIWTCKYVSFYKFNSWTKCIYSFTVKSILKECVIEIHFGKEWDFKFCFLIWYVPGKDKPFEDADILSCSIILDTYHNKREDQPDEEEAEPVHRPCDHVRCRACGLGE